MRSKRIQVTLGSPEDKLALMKYAASRGFATTSVLMKAALYEYLRRHKPPEDREWAKHVMNMLEPM